MATPAWSHAKAQWVVAMLALLVGSAMATEPYYYSSPPPPYEYKSPPPPVKSPPPPYEYKSPPPPSPPPPYYYHSPPPPVKSPPPPYYYHSPPPPVKSPPPPYYYNYPPPPVKSLPPPYYYNSPPPPVKSPPPPYVYSSPPPPPKSYTPPYYYSSPPPPVSYPHPHPHPHPLVFKVVGKVYCYRCYDWTHPKKSHDKKHLQGAVVEVTCKAGDKTVKAYGKTKNNGKYAITVKGYNYRKYGGDVCTAKLHAPPKGSPCNIPTDYHWGNKGAKLHVKSKTKDEVVLYAKSFAYAPKKPYGEFSSTTNPDLCLQVSASSNPNICL
ncbi:PREDICTED: extensin-1-like [Camelina sativa]|uniref:Extensin-1-like n=1 Tax=Camelina sativa TaxID=90675 RepID=A0ABM0YY06_CAMSA|nr:PREDICTED: extensin-1-like [Camelina sativa]